jgi:hypothetical protein
MALTRVNVFTNSLTLVWLTLHFPLCFSGCNCATVYMDFLWIYRYYYNYNVIFVKKNFYYIVIICRGAIIGREKKENEARILGLGPMSPCCPSSIVWISIFQLEAFEIYFFWF